MKPLRYVFVFTAFLALETVLCVLLPRIRASGVPASACLWIVFYVPAILVFSIFSVLVFKDGSRSGLSRLLQAAAGGFLASLLWTGIVLFVGLKVTGAGTLMTTQESAQPTSGGNR